MNLCVIMLQPVGYILLMVVSIVLCGSDFWMCSVQSAVLCLISWSLFRVLFHSFCHADEILYWTSFFNFNVRITSTAVHKWVGRSIYWFV